MWVELSSCRNGFLPTASCGKVPHRPARGPRPPADFAHQEDESFEPFPCSTPNVGADSLRCPHTRWLSSPRGSRLKIPDSCLQNCASHPTCGREHDLGFFGLPRAHFYCKSQCMMHAPPLAARPEPKKTKTACAPSPVNYNAKPVFRFRAPFGAL